jgi:hypothetical protein
MFEKIGWATFCAFFSPTHLVTLADGVILSIFANQVFGNCGQ